MNKEIYIFADWEELGNPIHMGIFYIELIRGKEIFSFEYTKEWLKLPFAQVLDPDLQLFSGRQYQINIDKHSFGMLLDSAPDRWGRVLMKRKEAISARKENREEKKLYETDFLLGVFDENRMGALRFKKKIDGDFLNNDSFYAVPPLAKIRELEQVSLNYEDDTKEDDLRWMDVLLAPGSSLGGARPKASVVDLSGNLWIAKFPSKNDEFDVGAWEEVARRLAVKSGINIAEGYAKRYSQGYSVYHSKRFDRTVENKRLHFASAMTMLGLIDGESEQSSYLDLVDFIINNGSNVDVNLKELFKRIVFSVCISNTDDHLRNHGFLLTNKGWILSPAYDINPNEFGSGLSININKNDNSLDLELALSVCDYFRLSVIEGTKIINDIKSVVSDWDKEAKILGISKREIEAKSSAFKF